MPTEEVMFDALLVKVPSAFDVTATVTVQLAIPAVRLPETATVLLPFAAVTTPDGQVVVAAGLVTLSPAGKVSVNDQPFFEARSVVLVIVNVRVDAFPTTWFTVENDLSSCGVASSALMSSNAESLPLPLPLPFLMRILSAVPLNNMAPFDE